MKINKFLTSIQIIIPKFPYNCPYVARSKEDKPRLRHPLYNIRPITLKRQKNNLINSIWYFRRQNG